MVWCTRVQSVAHLISNFQVTNACVKVKLFEKSADSVFLHVLSHGTQPLCVCNIKKCKVLLIFTQYPAACLVSSGTEPCTCLFQLLF